MKSRRRLIATATTIALVCGSLEKTLIATVIVPATAIALACGSL
jgi:hypothetical protein